MQDRYINDWVSGESLFGSKLPDPDLQEVEYYDSDTVLLLKLCLEAGHFKEGGSHVARQHPSAIGEAALHHQHSAAGSVW